MTIVYKNREQKDLSTIIFGQTVEGFFKDWL